MFWFLSLVGRALDFRSRGLRFDPLSDVGIFATPGFNPGGSRQKSQSNRTSQGRFFNQSRIPTWVWGSPTRSALREKTQPE